MSLNFTTDYSEFKKEQMKSEPNVIKVTLADLNLVDKQTLKIKGQKVTIGEGFVSNLVNLLGIPKRFISDYSHIMKDDAEGFINFLKDVKSAQMNKELFLLGKGNSVIGLQENFMPYEIFFKTFEDIMNRKNFEIQQLYGNNGNIHIQTVNKNASFTVGHMNDESFYPGFSLDNSIQDGLTLSSYIHRLVCTNGMIGKSSEEILRYDKPEKFYEGLGYLLNNDFVPKTFHQDVGRAMKTMASLDEAEQMRNLIRSTADTEIDKFMLERFIPLADSFAQLDRNKLDTYKMPRELKQNIPTNLSVWDVINGMTDFASHDYHVNVKESDRLNLQVKAGNLLTKKTFDTQNLIVLR